MGVCDRGPGLRRLARQRFVRGVIGASGNTAADTDDRTCSETVGRFRPDGGWRLVRAVGRRSEPDTWALRGARPGPDETPICSGRIWLESFDALLFPDKGNDRRDVVEREPLHGGHVAEAPVVGRAALLDCEYESEVSVVVRLVDD